MGPYITSLDMAGCSVTLLRADDELLRLWDHPVNTPGAAEGLLNERRPSTSPGSTAWIREFARVIGENAQYLTDLDAAIGDADHGINMDRGMTAVVAALDEAPPARHRRAAASRSA